MAYRNGHSVRLSTLRRREPVVTVVRDPVARFASAFWWLAARELPRWRDADELALAIGRDRRADEAMAGTLVFLPQRHWLDADVPLWWVGRTETLDEDARRLSEMLGITVALPPPGHDRRNAGPPHPPLGPEAEDAIRRHYADDYRLLEALHGR